MYSPNSGPYGAGPHGQGMAPTRPMPGYSGPAGMPSPSPASAYFPGTYGDQPEAARAEVLGMSPGLPSSHGPQHRQDSYVDQEQEKRQLQTDLRGKSGPDLAREAQSLRAQIRNEQESRQAKIGEYAQQLETLERENRQLQSQLMQVQMQDSAKLTDVTTVKKEVVAKTMELEKMMREFQQTHQDRLYSRVSSVTSAMLAVCQKQPEPPVPALAATSQSIPKQAPNPQASQPPPASQKAALNSAPAAAMAAEEPASGPGSALDPETQQLLKKRLQSLGDVVVHASDKFEACCASGRAIPPGTLRVRPRRCDHVFLVECLMPYWAEGICPVCRCSFAFDRPNDAGFMDESDKYSSVSTSISQAIPRHSGGSSTSDGGAMRGPRAQSLRTIDEAAKDQRGRSASAARKQRRNRDASASQGRSNDLGVERGIPGSPDNRGGRDAGSTLGDMKGAGGLGASGSMPGTRPAMPGSPPRSVVSHARSASGQRDSPNMFGRELQPQGSPPAGQGQGSRAL